MATIRTVVLCAALMLFGQGTIVAQSQAGTPRIGLLSPAAREEHKLFDQELLKGLEELGYVEGKNIVIEYRYANGKRDRLPKLAADLVYLKVDLIIAVSPPAIAAAIEATRTIPIVMVAGGDAVGRGFVHSMNQPGGNVTGLHSLSRSSGNRVELLKDAFPSLSRIAVLNARKRKHTVEAYQRHGKKRGLDVHVVNILTSGELEEAFSEVKRVSPGALIVVRNDLTIRYAKEIADFAIGERLPSMYRSEHFVRAGGLMSYGLDYLAMHRRAATYVDEILKGGNPAILPVEPPKHKFVINLKTANKIGAKIPPELLLEANEVIQ